MCKFAHLNNLSSAVGNVECDHILSHNVRSENKFISFVCVRTNNNYILKDKVYHHECI
jgi:hypothetical protein